MPTILPMQKLRQRSLLLLFLFSLVAGLSPAVKAAEASIPKLIISELQTGGLTRIGQEEGSKEFIELHNPSVDAVAIAGWKVEYISATQTGTAPATKLVSELTGRILPKGFMLLAFDDFLPHADVFFGQGSGTSSGFLARTGGHIRVVDEGGVIIDLVSWGKARPVMGFSEVEAIPSGMSTQRVLPGDPRFETMGLAFLAPTIDSTPLGGDTAPSDNLCSGLAITEILPNPAGIDTNKEFIELYNTTAEPVGLIGCELRIGEDGKSYAFEAGQVLGPMEYKAFFNDTTGLMLPNANAAEVWLISSSDEQSVHYKDNLDDQESWAFVEGRWVATQEPTPGRPNIFKQEQQPSTDERVLGSVAPCEAGKERNPATGRCRNIPMASEPVPCKEGQERSPVTNRCRSIIQAVSNKSCAEGQERNPETNRCRQIATVSEPKPCPAGQERNPETGRCRRLPPTVTQNAVVIEDVKAGPFNKDIRWWIIGIIGLGAAGYALYEWRLDVLLALKRMRSKLKRSK